MTHWLTIFLLAATPGLAAATPVAFNTSQPPPAVFTPAPVPDPDAQAPLNPAGKATAQVSPMLYNNPTQFMGMAYLPHSTVQDQQEQRLKPAPGISLSVPLQ